MASQLAAKNPTSQPKNRCGYRVCYM